MTECASCCKGRGETCEVRMALRRSQSELATSQEAFRSQHDRLCVLAVTAFSLLGEARVTESGITLSFFGDVSPESKLGLDSGGVFTDIDNLLKMMHPDDVEPYRSTITQAVSTGEPLQIIYRLSDGRGGWRWLKARACCFDDTDGKHTRWLHDTVDISEQKHTEEALRQTVAELQQLKNRLQRENLFLKDEAVWKGESVEIIGRSEPLMRVLQQVNLVAPTSATVLIAGETGTGKELIARAIHQHSERGKRLFVTVNCAALPSTLVESELFGHEKGAFTGANARRAGRFEQAEGGTLFLDEIGELPLDTQAKMLRVLQSGEYERVGGDRTLKADVRIIAASNRSLEQAVREGRFRSDLYHRLAVFPITLPPLRERREDIPLLAAYIVTQRSRKLGRRIDRISNAILDRLCAYDWPGNVRELENVLERAIILSNGTSLLPESVQLVPGARTGLLERGERHEAAPGAEASETLRTRERDYILRVCHKTAWKIKGANGAAAILGLNPGTLYARMKKLGIQRPVPILQRATW